MKKRTRGIIVSCNHAEYVLPDAMQAITKLADSWKPDALIHLGDFLNTDCMRSGASEKEQGKSLELDLDAGLKFVTDFFNINRSAKTRILFKGNHDVRPYEMCDHPKAIVRDCAKRVCQDIDYTARKCRAEFVPYDIRHGWRRLAADTMAGHGYTHSQNAVMQHANMIGGGNVVIGHLHRDEIVGGTTLSPSRGYCVGWLGDENLAHYARRRAATSRWTNAIATYETDGQETVINIHRRATWGWSI